MMRYRDLLFEEALSARLATAEGADGIRKCFEDVVANGSDILTRQPSESSFHELYELRDQIIDHLVNEYLSDPRPASPWRVVPAARIKALWKSSARTGFVRDIKGLDSIAQQFFYNVAALWANTELAGHGTSKPEDVLGTNMSTEGGSITPEMVEEFVEWVIEIDGNYGHWRISDYGLDPLIRFARLLIDCQTAEEKLMVCDAILSVVHRRSDIASWFVEGGASTLSDIFLQPITEGASMQTLYHVTFTSRVPRIKQEGIVPGKRRNWDRMFGGKYGDLGYVYLFTTEESAARWAHKMEWEFSKPCSIIVLRNVDAMTEDDPSGEAQMMSNGAGTWKRFKGAIPASCIQSVIPMSIGISKKLVGMTNGTINKFSLTESEDDRPDYPATLDERGLVDFAFQIAPDDDMDKELIEDMFRGYKAELKKIPIEGLKPNGGVEVSSSMRKYRKLKTAPPPIIVDNRDKLVMDGNHRVKIARERGITHLWAYVLTDADDEPF